MAQGEATSDGPGKAAEVPPHALVTSDSNASRGRRVIDHIRAAEAKQLIGAATALDYIVAEPAKEHVGRAIPDKDVVVVRSKEVFNLEEGVTLGVVEAAGAGGEVGADAEAAL